jgi:hypothetical protein
LAQGRGPRLHGVPVLAIAAYDATLCGLGYLLIVNVHVVFLASGLPAASWVPPETVAVYVAPARRLRREKAAKLLVLWEWSC